MNQIDVVLAVLLLLFALRGYSRGLVREGFGLLGLVGGMIGAAMAWQRIGAVPIDPRLPSAPLTGFATVGVTFVGVYVLCVLLGLLVDRLARAVFLGGINRVAGFGFGLAKGAAILGFLLAVVLRFSSPVLRARVNGSMLGEPLLRLAGLVVDTGRRALPSALPERQHI